MAKAELNACLLDLSATVISERNSKTNTGLGQDTHEYWTNLVREDTNGSKRMMVPRF